jgi:hypothetical protein
MNRTLKEATVNIFTYQTHQELEQHLHAYLTTYNFVKRLRALKGNSPWQFILDSWTKNPQYFNINPNLFFPGPNNQ